mmetsp:Transcript_28059/g.75834  ORF Transcript_28059/g.75834 Transcript_28059/m.75834 type:complete len:247 (+) Transcript_28059:1763-2503(+)
MVQHHCAQHSLRRGGPGAHRLLGAHPDGRYAEHRPAVAPGTELDSSQRAHHDRVCARGAHQDHCSHFHHDAQGVRPQLLERARLHRTRRVGACDAAGARGSRARALHPPCAATAATSDEARGHARHRQLARQLAPCGGQRLRRGAHVHDTLHHPGPRAFRRRVCIVRRSPRHRNARRVLRRYDRGPVVAAAAAATAAMQPTITEGVEGNGCAPQPRPLGASLARARRHRDESRTATPSCSSNGTAC